MTILEIAQKIENIRYGDLGKILFDFNGKTFTIKEPCDILLVGEEIGPVAKIWIATKYFLFFS